MAPSRARFEDDPPPWVMGLRRRTAALRVLPDLVIIGAMRCGTTMLHDLLVGSPHILGGARKEVHHFDREPISDLDDYRAWFPTRAELALRTLRHGVQPRVVEATPSYLLVPGAAESLARDLPAATAVVLLRHPTDRTISHWRFLTRIGREHLDLGDALAAEEAGEPLGSGRSSRPRTYLARSRYEEQLPGWLDALGSSRLAALRSEDLFTDPNSALNQVRAVLGLRPVDSVVIYRRNATRDPGADEHAAVRADLDDRYAVTIERTLELVGIDLRRTSQAA